MKRINSWLIFCVVSSFYALFVVQRSDACFAFTDRINIIPHKLKKIENNVYILMEKQNISLCNQLIFSWNSLVPEKGYFKFFIQVRDAETKQWDTYHHMYDWGKTVKSSYFSKKGKFSRYEHVRLEMDQNRLLDGFRIKVECCDGATIASIKSCTVASSNYEYFIPEIVPKEGLQYPSVYIKNIPTLSQFLVNHTDKNRICSPTSLSMLVQFLGYKEYSVEDCVHQVYDLGLDTYGNWVFNMAYAFVCCDQKFEFYVRRLESFAHIYKQLQAGLPTIVSVRGQLPGAPLPYNSGHLLMVVGWNRKKQLVLVHDPAFDSTKKVFTGYPLVDFLSAWERSRRLAYWVEQC